MLNTALDVAIEEWRFDFDESLEKSQTPGMKRALFSETI